MRQPVVKKGRDAMHKGHALHLLPLLGLPAFYLLSRPVYIRDL